MISRRNFAAGGLASIAFAGLARCAAANAEASYRNELIGYGPLVKDRAGILDLPKGFSYRIISQAGEAMDDGFVVPDHFDGMGCVALADDRIALVRNHELLPADQELGPTSGRNALHTKLRALGHFGADDDGRPLPGGTTTIVYDVHSGRRERQYLSLAGTTANCAGGMTPWGSWLSCEETDLKPGGGVRQDHGWIFEVPARQAGLAEPVPLKAMGRFRHEAAAVDPRTGIVYLTEDREDGLFYRFLPARNGRLREGGRLQALGLRDAPAGNDTRGWNAPGIERGSWQQAYWIDIDAVEAPDDDLRMRGHAAGAALFARGEGIYCGDGEIFFTCTTGGAEKIGQIMRYVPSPREGQADEQDQPARLQLFVESDDRKVMNYADNITIAPWGHLIVCEDGGQDDAVNHIRGISSEGRAYTLARLGTSTEFAGACFAPDRSTLFVNLYKPGKTVAITGPWASVKVV